MDALMNYFFPPRTETKTIKDVKICMTRGDTIMILRLSDVADMTLNELAEYRSAVIGHVMETFDSEECDNGNIILAEMDRRIDELKKKTG